MNRRSLSWLFALLLGAPALHAADPARDAPSAPITTKAAMTAHDARELHRLNGEYVRAFLESDVDWFERHLAADFRCILSSGVLIDRAAFLRNVAQPVTMNSFEIEDVAVQFVDDTAIVQARTRYETAEGRLGGSRYTDLWVLRDGRWQALVAQITAIAEPADAP